MSLTLVTVSLFLTFFFLSGAKGQCSNEAKLFITAPKTIDALSGSCVLIPCSFRGKEGVSLSGDMFGVWIKKDSRFSQNKENVIFNSSEPENIYPMEIIGNLSQNNCTTLFYNLTTKYTDKYFFRVENKLFNATASCDPIQITVKEKPDFPQNPRIEFSADVMDLKENQSVSITCSALTPCPLSPPELTWSLQPDSHRQTETNTDGTFTTKIQENITLSDSHDGSSISCSVRYPVDGGKGFKTAETEVTLHVSYAPKDTSASISPSGLVSAGSWVNLSCSSRANPPVSSFSWFRISSEGPVRVSEEQIYRFNVTEGGEFYCVATNHLGNQTSSVILLSVREQSSSLGAVVGGIIGVIIIIGVVIFIWWLKPTHLSSRQTQSLVLQEPACPAENQDIHYGEIDFSKLRPSVESVQDGTDPQSAVYSQVKLCKTQKKSLNETGDDIYSQVKKK